MQHVQLSFSSARLYQEQQQTQQQVKQSPSPSKSLLSTAKPSSSSLLSPNDDNDEATRSAVQSILASAAKASLDPMATAAMLPSQPVPKAEVQAEALPKEAATSQVVQVRKEKNELANERQQQ